VGAKPSRVQISHPALPTRTNATTIMAGIGVLVARSQWVTAALGVGGRWLTR
jgi:hypothetical protein